MHRKDPGKGFDLAILLPDEKQTMLMHIFSRTGLTLGVSQDGASLFREDQKGIVHVKIMPQNQSMLRLLFQHLSEAGIVVLQCSLEK